MPLLKLFAWVRTLNEGSSPVSELSDVVIAPVEEAAKVKSSYAMSPSTLDMVDKACIVLLVEYVRQVGHKRQILHMARPVYTK